MPLHGARADVQLGTDLWVSATIAGESRDLLFLRGQLVAGFVSALAHLLATGQQLASRPFGESRRAHGHEHVICLVELLARVDPPVLTAQPLAVAEPGTSKVRRDPRLRERLDRRSVQLLGRLTVREERARAGLGSFRPIRPAGARSPAELVEGFTGDLCPPASGSRLDEFGQRPR